MISAFNSKTAQSEEKFLCDIIAPLGGPVVPLVYEKVKHCYGLTSAYNGFPPFPGRAS